VSPSTTGDPASTAEETLSPAGAATDAVVIRLGAGRFAVDLTSVAEVGRVPSLTRVPGLPGWVAGVANWRGRILAVLDLRELLGAESGVVGPQARLVIIGAGPAVAGLLVDAVDGTLTLGGDVAPFPGALPAAAAGLLSGQAPLEDGPVAVLDVRAVIALRESLPRGRRTA